MGDLFAEADVVPLDLELARNALHVLHKHYPGWSWVVDVPRDQNILVVRNLDLSLRRPWGFVLHKTSLYADRKLLAVMRAGGELLERYRQFRGSFGRTEIMPVRQIFTRPET